MSTLPPGGNGTTTLTGPVGQVWADATPKPRIRKNKTLRRRYLIMWEHLVVKVRKEVDLDF
jgi:hypothetical protein